jgi:hypothetical protein
VHPHYNICERCHEFSDDDGTYAMTMIDDFELYKSEERFYKKEMMDSYRMLESRKQLWMATRVMTREDEPCMLKEKIFSVMKKYIFDNKRERHNVATIMESN